MSNPSRQKSKAASAAKSKNPRLNLPALADKSIQRLTPFPGIDEDAKGGKAISNRINSTGDPAKVICVSCLAVPSQHSQAHKLGRGTSQFNEVVACIVSKQYGDGGSHCARCVGLGNGGSCTPVPEKFAADARKLIALIVDYNKVLTGKPNTWYRDLSEEEQESINKAKGAAAKLKSIIDGDKKKNPDLYAKPSKKRKLDESLERVASDTRSDIAAVAEVLEEVTEQLAELRREVRDVNRKLRVGRERERVLVELVTQLHEHAKDPIAEWGEVETDLLKRSFEDEDPEREIRVRDGYSPNSG